jgi:hypothetical protein
VTRRRRVVRWDIWPKPTPFSIKFNNGNDSENYDDDDDDDNNNRISNNDNIKKQ